MAPEHHIKPQTWLQKYWKVTSLLIAALGAAGFGVSFHFGKPEGRTVPTVGTGLTLQDWKDLRAEFASKEVTVANHNALVSQVVRLETSIDTLVKLHMNNGRRADSGTFEPRVTPER